MKKMKKQSEEKKNRRKEETRMALPSLPNEITDKIFLNVPMRNLLEFRCVVRDYSRFHNPNFIKMHLNQQMEIENGSTFIIKTASKIYKFDFEALADPIELVFPFRNPTCTTPIVLAASCNGLLCLTHNSYFYGRIVYLWNPVTGEYKQLPAQNFLRPRRVVDLELGYDHISGKFKVIAIQNLRDGKTGYKIVTFVYTVGTSSWRSIEEIRRSSYHSWNSSKSKVFEGCPHWIDYDVEAVVSFNIGDEKFKEIPIPPLEWDPRYCHWTTDLTAFGGRLSIFYHVSKLKRHELWVRMDDGFESTWIKQLSFNDLHIDFWENRLKPWGYKNGLVLLQDTDSRQRKFKRPILFDPETNAIRALYLRGEPKHFDVYSYIESLAMLTVEDGGDVHQNT